MFELQRQAIPDEVRDVLARQYDFYKRYCANKFQDPQALPIRVNNMEAGWYNFLTEEQEIPDD